MILLLGLPNFDEGKHQDTRAEEHPRGWRDTSHVPEYVLIFERHLFKQLRQRVKTIPNIFLICITTCKEKNANNVRHRCINNLQNTFKGKPLLIVFDYTASNKIAQPKSVHSGEIFNLISFSEPLFPIIVMFLILHSSHTSGVILKGSECNDVGITV